MDIVKGILRILKSINLKYEKNKDNHSIDLNLNDVNLEGTLSVKVNKDKQPEISASLGKGGET